MHIKKGKLSSKKVKLSSKYGEFRNREKPPMAWLKWVIAGYCCIVLYVLLLSFFTGK